MWMAVTAVIRVLWAEARSLGREVFRRHPGKVGSIATVLGLASDIGSPWQDFLSWLITLAAAVAVVALILRWLFWSADGQTGWAGRLRRFATSAAASSSICFVVFALLFQAQLAFSGPGGLVAEQMPAVAELQNRIAARLDRLDDALAVLRGDMSATREGIGKLNVTAEETRQGVESLNQTAEATREGVERLAEKTGKTQSGVESLNEQMEFSVALAIIDRVREAQDGSLQGQGRAFAALLAEGYDFVGADFSGVAFRGTDLSGADFSESELNFADFRSAILRDATLAGSYMKLAQADGASDFAGADLSGVYAPLLDAPGANFDSARLRGSSFYAGNFRGAQFAGADLSGSAFAYADLRDSDLRGANLSGAHLVGALLTGAQLDGAIFDQTNMLAAVLDPVALSAPQRAAACRHRGSLQYGYGRFAMVERWESNKYDSGYEFDDINEYEADFPTPGYDDVSLPVCTSDPASAEGFSAVYPFDEEFRLERTYLEKAGRRNKAEVRFRDFRERLIEGQASGVMFRGDGGYRDQWLATLTAAAAVTTPVGPAYPDGDFLLPFLLAMNIVREEEIDWRRAFETRFQLERTMRGEHGGNFAANTHWSAFLPEEADLSDMPSEAEALFRKWTTARAKGDFAEIVLQPPAEVEHKADGIAIARLSQNYYRKTSYGLNFEVQSATSQSAEVLEAFLGSRERFVESPALRNAFGLQKLLFVFPQAFADYGLTLPGGASNSAAPGTLPVDLVVSVDRAVRVPDYPAFVAVFVTPIRAELKEPDRASVSLVLSTRP